MKYLYCILILLLVSCHGETGDYGVVENSDTQNRIEAVKVTLKTDGQPDVVITTDVNGYFNSYDYFACGIGKRCKPDYSITFEKEGYETLTIDKGYRNSSQAEFVTSSRDSILIKLISN